MMTLRLYDTYTRGLRDFEPLQAPEVGLYSCGPTVYDYAHLGNLRTYIFVDLLRRVLLFNGYAVKHVMNITDVGHLTSDADTGEDKMATGQRRAGQSAWDIAEKYPRAFQDALTRLNVLAPTIWCRAAAALNRLRALAHAWGEAGTSADDYVDRFAAQVNADLNLPRAVAVLWDLAKSDLPDATKKATLLHFDRVLGLGLAGWQPAEAAVPADIWQLVQQRQQARAARQWPLADQLRARIGAAGYVVEDTPQGPQLHHVRTKEPA